VTPLPIVGAKFVAWRIDRSEHAPTWDSGIGSHLFGGRWSPIGFHAVYASVDPSTAVLELAVHVQFEGLDSSPYSLTSFEIPQTDDIHIVEPDAVPNLNWLVPGAVSAGQQKFGADLMAKHPFVAVPSVVSSNSWNIVFSPTPAGGRYRRLAQERLRIDGRLVPAARRAGA